jgi:hypothetical protein
MRRTADAAARDPYHDGAHSGRFFGETMNETLQFPVKTANLLPIPTRFFQRFGSIQGETTSNQP